MGKIEIANTVELNDFMRGTETRPIIVPPNTNFLLLNDEAAAEYTTELEAMARRSRRSLHLR